jgi:hypothetical protein
MLEVLLRKAEEQGYLSSDDLSTADLWLDKERLNTLQEELYNLGIEILGPQDDLGTFGENPPEHSFASPDPRFLSSFESVASDDTVGLYLKCPAFHCCLWKRKSNSPVASKKRIRPGRNWPRPTATAP